MKKKFTATLVSLLLILIPGTALSQLSPPFRPLQPPVSTTTQKYSSDQYKFSFAYPQGWQVKEEQGAVNVNESQNLAWITMWRVTENVDPQTYVQNIESQLKQQWQNYAVTSRKQIKINSIDTLRVDGEATSQGKVWIFTLLVLHQDNLAKLMVGSGAVKEQYPNLSPILEQIFGSVSLLDGATPSPTCQQAPQPPQTVQTPRVTGWFRYQMSQILDINHPMAVTYIEYPQDWQVIPDYYQRRVTFSKDSGGTTSFTLCPIMDLVNPAQRTASEFFQLLFAEMNQGVPDLKIVKQDFPQFQNIAGTIISEGRVELQGTENGIPMSYYAWINYGYSSQYSFSVGTAIFSLAKAPSSQFVDTKRHIFDRMVKSFSDSIPKAQPPEPQRR